MVKTLPLALVLALLLGAPGPSLAQGVGTVEGTLDLRSAPAKRQAPRYPGAGARTARLQEVPAVVWLTGDLPAAEPPDSAVTILQEDGRFVPGALAVPTGTVVRFPNGDPYYHNVFSYSGPRFDLGRYPPGESRRVTLDEPGVVGIFCEIHESMRAVVVVTDHAFQGVVGEDGVVRFEDVPAGRHTLHAYHPDLGSVETPVTVEAGATVRVSLELGP